MTRRRVALSLAQQAFALRARFPGVHAALSARQLVWIGELQPTSLSRRYTVELTYARQRFPRVRVLDELEVRAGEKSLPHVYSDGSLCLHRDDEWSSQMFLADTILPWAAEWLAHYEIWFATGTWYGGGEWPPRRVGATDASPAGLEGDARRAAAMSLTTKAPLDELPDVVERVGFENSVIGRGGCHAAASYSLMRPPSSSCLRMRPAGAQAAGHADSSGG